MDEKEERIFIRKGTARELCKFIYRDDCAGEMHCCFCAISIPRSEAIDKMAKSMFLQINKNDDWEKFRKNFPRNQFIWHAKAALNALLEDKK